MQSDVNVFQLLIRCKCFFFSKNVGKYEPKDKMCLIERM